MIRNKFLLLYVCLACLSLFTSCNKESENHTIFIVHPSQYDVLFADQVDDSLIFETFDSYSLESLSDWITITDGDSYTVNYDHNKLYRFTSLLSLTQNTTGRTRVGAVKINSYYTNAAIFTQYGFLNISHPFPMPCESSLHKTDSVSFELELDATATVDSICFNVSKPWNMECSVVEDNWITLDKTQGNAGFTKITLNLTANTDTENSRNTELTLKCGEVTNIINIKQLPAKEQTVE